MNKLIFQNSPTVELGTNKFVNTPIVLQFDDTPLIQVVRGVDAGYTTEIPIYHEDGTYLAKAVGSQLYKTADGEKAGLVMEYPDKKTICKLNGKVIFELDRQEAASLKTAAELHTPTGYFIRYSSARPDLLGTDGKSLNILGMVMTGCVFEGNKIGVWVRSDGSMSIGCN